MKGKEFLFGDITHKIIGLCFNVHAQLGGGLLEKAYQNALAIALKKAEINYKEQARLPMYYNQTMVDYGYADFLVDDKIIVEIKRDSNFHISRIKQVEKYLVAIQQPIGLLIHFGYEKVYVKRIINRHFFNSQD
ncbi:MAG: GxxExxY protein [Bacteroidia bacterium]|nr:GxxExxY protein [Bacteroidia bacterium]